MEKKDLIHTVLLHSNDLHADFHSKEKDEKLVGGISRLSGYLKKVRKEVGADNVMYAIAGDLFRGDVIDSEFLGLSTINIINYLKPDVCCIGNHEVDYGIAHSILLEKLADFPVINANIYFKYPERRLYQPYAVLGTEQYPILCIGVTTENVSHQLLMDQTVGAYVEVRDPAEEVKKLLGELDTKKFSSIMIISHIGLEEDMKLAEQLDPSLGVRAIIGGHSHTLMEEPMVVNGIPIVQAGTGTGQIGRFDLWFDPDTAELADSQWKIVEVSDRECELDPDCEEYVDLVKRHVDDIYGAVLFRMDRKATNPARNVSTGMNMVYADILAQVHGVDVALLNGGSVRAAELGPLVTKGDFRAAYPYLKDFYGVETTAGHLRDAVARYYTTLKNTIADPHSSVLMCSGRLSYTWNEKTKQLDDFRLDGTVPADDVPIRLGLNDYIASNDKELLDAVGIEPKMIASDLWTGIQKYFEAHTEVWTVPTKDYVTIIT